jgi:hypothetical protein
LKGVHRGAREARPWEWVLGAALAIGFLWTVVAQFYDPSAGYDSFPLPSIGALIEIGAFAILFLFTTYFKYGRRAQVESATTITSPPNEVAVIAGGPEKSQRNPKNRSETFTDDSAGS